MGRRFALSSSCWRLNRLSPLNQAVRNQVLALSLADVRDSVQQTATEYEFPPTVARAVQKPYDARIQEVTSAGSLEERISDRDRIVLGLIALANRERQLVLEHHGLQTVSSDIIEALLRNAGEIYDGARTADESAITGRPARSSGCPGRSGWLIRCTAGPGSKSRWPVRSPSGSTSSWCDGWCWRN